MACITDPEKKAALRSEGVAELIERLAVASFKGEAVAAECVVLANKIGGTAGNLISQLINANRDLWVTKDEQATAVEKDERDVVKLRLMIDRDIQLCAARARIRGELNAILGDLVSSESVKRYGGS